MSAIATPGKANRTVYFYQSTIGKKAVMAVTGFVLFGYLVVHMAANLLVFTGPELINSYAAVLHARPAVLWGARALLLAAVVLHIVSSAQLWMIQRAARPTPYYKKGDVPTAYAARTMLLSGPIIAGFVVFHILNLTTGDIGPFIPGDVYHNVVRSFQLPWISAIYIVSVTLLGFHLFHGLWSMFQSMGLSHPRYTPALKKFAAVFAFVITAGFLSIPISVLAGVIR
jgi:succinate dehydrogenase / fumarate reductase, cytochrome b subunit